MVNILDESPRDDLDGDTATIGVLASVDISVRPDA